MNSASSPTPADPLLPWRSVWLAKTVGVAALLIGVPLFLRMPPWCDVTLYDVAARNLLDGGVHYRDVFDTNTPGYVWILTLIRATLGWGVEALRAVDLLIVAGSGALLAYLAKRAGADRAARWWAVAGVALFYPFASEFNHAQRDVWMLLPALVAVTLRVRRLARPPLAGAGEPPPSTAWIEGALWGAAVWIKPHVVVPAAAVWLLTAPLLTGHRARLADLLGNVAGGLLVGAAGVAYLVGTGTWPHLLEVFTVWNTGYTATTLNEVSGRVPLQLGYFPPWSYLQPAAILVALASVIDALPGRPVGRRLPRWLWNSGTTDVVRTSRLAFAALYLGWVTQALVIQREFHYAHAPETLMLLFVLATQRWAAGCLVAGSLAATSALVLAGAAHATNTTGMGPAGGPSWAILHPAVDPVRLDLWDDCWETGLTAREYRQRMNSLGQVRDFHAANDWEQLGEVADWLRARDVRDGELLCWDDAPHALYLELRLRPAFRFQHVGQMMGISHEHTERVRDELRAAPRPRWVVADLLRVENTRCRAGRLADAGPDWLPDALPDDIRASFPYNQPAVHRTGQGHGRYVVFELARPLTWTED